MNIFITGAESTGKSKLAEELGLHYKTIWVPEYAREYMRELNRDYNIDDLGAIAEKQIDQILLQRHNELVFFDTGLIITYIWYQHKYGAVPLWFEEAVNIHAVGKYLVCQPDIPWKEDPLRENPLIRDELNKMYIDKIINMGFDYAVIEGRGKERKEKAVRAVDGWLR